MAHVIEKGETVLVVHRRLFTDDQQRFFIGKVEAYDDGVARVNGYTWRPDPHHNRRWQRKSDIRTKLVALGSGTLIVYPIPVVDIDAALIDTNAEGLLVVRDGSGFEMDVSERAEP